jgi:hypothetical protein
VKNLVGKKKSKNQFEFSEVKSNLGSTNSVAGKLNPIWVVKIALRGGVRRDDELRFSLLTG